MFIFPAHRFNPETVKAGVAERVLSGGESLSGDQDVIAVDGGGRWTITYGGIDLEGVGLLRLWDQWVSFMGGGVTRFLVPLLTLDTAPRPFAGRGLACPSDILADDPSFPTSVGFALPHITAVTVGVAALRATTITITVTRGARIAGGEVFSVGNRAHRIERVVSRPTASSAQCVISPPLRAAVSSGTAVNFDWPVVQCRLAPGQDLTPERDWSGNAIVSLTFLEDFGDVE